MPLFSQVDIIGEETQDTPSAADLETKPVLQIWKSEHVDQYRWVLTFGHKDSKVYNGNAKSFEQALKDIEICQKLYISGTV